MTKNHTYASSFADPRDVAAFNECKEQGMSDTEAFKYGDNAQGCWGGSTAEGTGPSCALPPEYMEERWGGVKAAKHKEVVVSANNVEVVCVLKDRMPHLDNLHNAARIDLNPDACAALGLEIPLMAKVQWWWKDDEEA